MKPPNPIQPETSIESTSHKTYPFFAIRKIRSIRTNWPPIQGIHRRIGLTATVNFVRSIRFGWILGGLRSRGNRRMKMHSSMSDLAGNDRYYSSRLSRTASPAAFSVRRSKSPPVMITRFSGLKCCLKALSTCCLSRLAIRSSLSW